MDDSNLGGGHGNSVVKFSLYFPESRPTEIGPALHNVKPQIAGIMK